MLAMRRPAHQPEGQHAPTDQKVGTVAFDSFGNVETDENDDGNADCDTGSTRPALTRCCGLRGSRIGGQSFGGKQRMVRRSLHWLPGRGASYPVSDKTAREEHP